MIHLLTGADGDGEHILPGGQGTGKAVIVGAIRVVRKVEVEFDGGAARRFGYIEVTAGAIRFRSTCFVTKCEEQVTPEGAHVSDLKDEKFVGDAIEFKLSIGVFNITLFLTVVGRQHHWLLFSTGMRLAITRYFISVG